MTHDLLRSELQDAIEEALKGGEQCALSTMRLVELLLILLCEGKSASGRGAADGLPGASLPRRLDTAGEKSDRQSIGYVRLNDTDALILAIDHCGIKAWFRNDVGRTLLNWASAFGTPEMVEFLCQRRAVMNQDQRSSSLHYAVRFGRPANVKVLLTHGADPSLRDEDGKNSYHKASEGADEGHRKVAATILQFLNESLLRPNRSHRKLETKVEETTDKECDPEMASAYLTRLLPAFCATFQSATLSSVRNASLSLIRRIMHYIQPELLIETCGSEDTNYRATLVEIIATVLDNEEDKYGHLIVLQMIRDLMVKEKDEILEHFARFGVVSKVATLATERESETNQSEEEQIMEDARELLEGRAYHWYDWCICRDYDYLCGWSEAAALELWNTSEGMFEFILDGKWASMDATKRFEGETDTTETGRNRKWVGGIVERFIFVDRFRTARKHVHPNTVSQPILSRPSTARLVAGNWIFSSPSENELHIHNTAEPQQAIILREDLFGFIFQSNRGTKHSFTAKTSLDPTFLAGWPDKSGKRLPSEKEAFEQTVKNQAREIYEHYFEVVQAQTRGVVADSVQM